MNHSHEAPKLPKLPFIAGDLALLATATLLALRGPAPLTPLALLAITVCVVVGSALAVVPFLADYARRQDAELTERQHQIAALARTTSDSAEQLGIVASGLNGISEASKHNLDAIGQLPARLQERIDQLTQQLAGSVISAHTSAQEDVARLESAAEKITRALTRLESAAQTRTTALAAAEKELAATLARAVTQIDALLASARSAAEVAPAPAVTPPQSAAPAPTPPPAPTEEPVQAPVIVSEPAPVPPEPAPAHIPEPTTTPPPAPAADDLTPPPFAPAEPAASDVPVDEPPAPKPPRARKPKPADDIPDLGLTPDTSEPSESAITSDGFTRLIATAYIGIGNKLYIRGDGPGLSWDKGVPLQFVSIGKWRWETPDAAASFTAKLYKNDQVECTGLGLLSLEPGHQHEVNAGF